MSRRSSVSSSEDSLLADRAQTALITSKLNHQLSHLTWHSPSINGCVSRSSDNSDTAARDRQQLAVSDSGNRQVSVIKANRVQKATNNVPDAVNPHCKKIQSLQLDQKTSPMLSGGRAMSTTMIKHRELTETVNSQPTSSNNEITIARHKPTVSSNISVPTQHDSAGGGATKVKNAGRTSRLTVKPHSTASQTT